MVEQDMAEYYDQRRGDVSLWADKPVKARVAKGGRAVFSIRLARDELETLQRAASVRGLTVSDFMRRAALEEASTEEDKRLVTTLPDRVMAAGFVVITSGHETAAFKAKTTGELAKLGASSASEVDLVGAP